MELVVDWCNGGKWQWKYYCPTIGRWFDYGPAFDKHSDAKCYILYK